MDDLENRIVALVTTRYDLCADCMATLLDASRARVAIALHELFLINNSSRSRKCSSCSRIGASVVGPVSDQRAA
jgi:hypothetical protein